MVVTNFSRGSYGVLAVVASGYFISTGDVSLSEWEG